MDYQDRFSYNNSYQTTPYHNSADNYHYQSYGDQFAGYMDGAQNPAPYYYESANVAYENALPFQHMRNSDTYSRRRGSARARGYKQQLSREDKKWQTFNENENKNSNGFTVESDRSTDNHVDSQNQSSGKENISGRKNVDFQQRGGRTSKANDRGTRGNRSGWSGRNQYRGDRQLDWRHQDGHSRRDFQDRNYDRHFSEDYKNEGEDYENFAPRNEPVDLESGRNRNGQQGRQVTHKKMAQRNWDKERNEHHKYMSDEASINSDGREGRKFRGKYPARNDTDLTSEKSSMMPDDKRETDDSRCVTDDLVKPLKNVSVDDSVVKKDATFASSRDDQQLGARAKSYVKRGRNCESAQELEDSWDHSGRNSPACSSQQGERSEQFGSRPNADTHRSWRESNGRPHKDNFGGSANSRQTKSGGRGHRNDAKMFRKNGDVQNEANFAEYGNSGNGNRSAQEKKQDQYRNPRGERESKYKKNFDDRGAGLQYKNSDGRSSSAFGEHVEQDNVMEKPKQIPSKDIRNQDAVSSKSKDNDVLESSDLPMRSSRNERLSNSTQEEEASKWQDETQRGLLIDQLCAEQYECLVCCNAIRRDAAVWSCSNCYHVYHMYCIKKWANSPAASTGCGEAAINGWRCPTCQNPYPLVPNQYMCFCGKQKDPEFSRFATPHSCNEMCGRERCRGCPHPCNLLCHPGPCPPCTAFVMRSCDCGKSKRSVRCAGDATGFKCGEPCRRTLNCGMHECASSCHAGPCEPCAVTQDRKCYCGQETRTVLCGSKESFVIAFSCDKVCSRKLACGVHTCEEKCHPGMCGECPLRPAVVTTCPCGKSNLLEMPGVEVRKSCEDPVPTCKRKCGKELRCGSEATRHRCKEKCHHGPCKGTCKGTTEATCRCGAVTKDLPCAKFLEITESSPFLCDRRCKKKMSCGRHKCNQLCCVSTEHQCQQLCGYKLSCGQHRCEEPCHRGNCPPCWQVSFDELHCHCGAAVIYPPVACGTKPPECNQPCRREHACSHKQMHHCHNESTCPPCTVLTEKWCMGHHELRRNIPCHIAEISCGMQCGKELPCVIHKCLLPCHKGPCFTDDQVCTQPCQMVRKECGHPCNAPCHPNSPCPATVCKAEITLQCECGRRKEKGLCLQGHELDGQSDYSKMTAQFVASKLWEGQSIDLSLLTKEISSNKKTRKLQCDSECSIMARNRRLALALEIKNPDLSNKLGNAQYSQFLKDFAKQNPAFVANVEKALATVVTAAQQMKAAGRKSHAFKVMPSVQRRVIHELAESYGCQTESYDEEPNKNVVATAVKDKCWLPNVTLTSLTQRELFPKAPMPIPINCKEDQLRSASIAAKQSTEVFAAGKEKTGNSSSRRRNGEAIDYFDVTD